MTVSLERRAVGVCEWAGNGDGLRCVVSGGGNDVCSALTWWKVLSPWSSIHYQSSSGRWIGSLLPHCWRDREPGWVSGVAQRSAGNPQGQDLALVPLPLCFSHRLEGEDTAEVRSWVLVLTSPLPCSWTWVLIKRQGLFHLILLICGTWKNGTGELICKTEIESQMERTNLHYQGGKERWGESGDCDWQKWHYLPESG